MGNWGGRPTPAAPPPPNEPANGFFSPPFSLASRVLQKVIMELGASQRNPRTAPLADPALGSVAPETRQDQTLHVPTSARSDTILAGQQRRLSPSGGNGAHRGTTMNGVWEAIGLSPTTWTTMSASWSPSTQRQYACALSKWARFISLNNVPPTSPSADQCLCFFQSMVEQGASYGPINATRSFLSACVNVDNMPAGEHPLITRFLKGLSNLRPSRPRYTQTWDPSVALH